ncbi:MAG: transposase [Nostoc sp.]
MENISQWVGIDVSKATLDVYIRPMGKALKVANTEVEISHLVEQLKSSDLNLIVLEATGGLETELIIQLQAALLPVALINPRLQVNLFILCLMPRASNVRHPH